MGVIIQLRRDKASNWSTVNPVLRDGELGIERDTGKAKLGDGLTMWNFLSYWQPSGADTDNYDAAGSAAAETTRAQAAEALLAPLAGAAFTGPVSVSQSNASGGMLIVANAHTTPSSPSVQLMAAASGDQVLGIGNTGEAFPRVMIDSAGNLSFGSGSSAPDASLFRNSIGQLRTSKFDIDSSQTAGQQFQVINRHAGSTTANTIFQSQGAGDPNTAIQVSGDTVPRLLIDSNGQMSWGSGAGAADVSLSRIAAGQLQTNAMKMVNNSTAGNVLFIQNSHSAPTAPSVTLHAQAAADQTLGISVTGDAQQRLIVDSNGQMSWGPGNAATDTNLYRNSSGELKTDHNFTVNGAAKTIVTQVTGLSGAGTSSRYVGATAGGPPLSGTFITGDYVVDTSVGAFWVCTTGGSPGIWDAGGGNDWLTTQQVATGETVLPRINIGNGPALLSGKVQFSYFTAQKTETCTFLGSLVANTAAAATPTVCQMGLYSVDGSGNLTSVAIGANDTTMWATTFVQYNSTVASFTKQAGQRYAFALLCVGAGAMPNFFGFNGTLAFSGLAPVLVKASGTGQSALLSSYTAGSLLGTSAMYTGLVSP